MELRLRTNAKVNLFLAVSEKLPDGFHSIETVFQSVSLSDELVLKETGSTLEVQVQAGSNVGPLPTSGENIVTRAAEELATAAGRFPQDHISITKHIPIGAGLAGGSANAAGALIGLQRLWATEMDLGSLALGLGADVPFCLQGGTALARGKGEVLETLPTPQAMWFVLGISAEPLSTAQVYGRWTPADRGAIPASAMVDALASGSLEDICSALRNDLEFPAFRLRPELEAKKDALAQAGALGVSLSGSGPTLLAMAADRAHAVELAKSSRHHFDRIEVVWSVPRCVEEQGSDS